MRANKAALGVWLLVAAVPSGMLLASCLGYRVVFLHPWLTACCLVALAVALTVWMVWFDAEQTVVDETLAMLMPFVAECALLSLIARGAVMVFVGTVFCVCAIAAAYRCVKETWMRVVAVVLALPLLMPIGLFGLFALFPMSEKTVLQTAVSPDGAYIAELIDDDQGALGGATVVTVRSTKGEIDLVLFSLEHKPRTVYHGDWGEGFHKNLAWKDDQTVTLDGMPISIEP